MIFVTRVTQLLGDPVAVVLLRTLFTDSTIVQSHFLICGTVCYFDHILSFVRGIEGILAGAFIDALRVAIPVVACNAYDVVLLYGHLTSVTVRERGVLQLTLLQ